MIERFASDESGATAIECGLIAAGLAIAVTMALGGTGAALKVVFNAATEKLATP